MVDVGAILVESLNAQALIDDLTRRNVPEEEMKEARTRRNLVQMKMASTLKCDVSLPPGQQWRLYEEGELLQDVRNSLKDLTNKT